MTSCWICASLTVAALSAAPDDKQKYDLLLKGGHVIDPAASINEPRDVAVAGDKIAAVEKEIAADRARRVVDVSGYYVTPGLVDIHAHVHIGRSPTRQGYPADMHLASGVTTAVDAGTWGADDFHLLKENIVDLATVRVLAFLNIVAAGMGDHEQDVGQMDPGRCAVVCRQYPDVIVGIKTAHYWTSAPWDEDHPPWAAVDAAIEAAELAGLPVMVDFWPRPPERSYRQLILEKLRPGDIHTHVFAQQFPILDSDGKVNEFLLEARARGIHFDLGHGAGSFWFRNAAPAIEQGFVPQTISTDLHMRNVNGPVVDMITTMSKIMALGVPLEDVIRRSTQSAARAIRRPELGTLAVGQEADIAVIELRKGRFGYTDCGRAKIVANTKLENRMTVRAGRIVYDPEGLSMVEWQNAPPQYFTTPKLQYVDPPATADPQQLREWHATRGRR